MRTLQKFHSDGKHKSEMEKQRLRGICLRIVNSKHKLQGKALNTLRLLFKQHRQRVKDTMKLIIDMLRSKEKLAMFMAYHGKDKKRIEDEQQSSTKISNLVKKNLMNKMQNNSTNQQISIIQKMSTFLSESRAEDAKQTNSKKSLTSYCQRILDLSKSNIGVAFNILRHNNSKGKSEDAIKLRICNMIKNTNLRL